MKGSTHPMPHRLPPALQGPLGNLPFELPHAFLGAEPPVSDFETARSVILPVPYESTTSYSGGTRLGPHSILEASRFVELYDQELDTEICEVGIHTLPALELTKGGPAEAAAELEAAYTEVLRAIGDRFPIVLGGEHGISAPLIRAMARHLAGGGGTAAAAPGAASGAAAGTAAADGERLTVLQLDAHADLRDGYEGTTHSHASFAFRTLDVADYVQVGIRAVSSEERAVMRAHPERIRVFWADQMWDNDRWMDEALAALGPRVYLTVDVDYFDPSLVPSTGTPEPGGGDWYRTLRFLRRVFRERTVVGADVVEHAPIPGFHAPDFLVAKLVYKLIGYRFCQGA
jgi:agmatinase